MTPWTAARQASLSFTISWSLLKLMSTVLMMPFNSLILCLPLPLLPSIFPSIRVFYSESALRIRWPKYWSLSFSISPPNDYSGLISFRIDWFDILAVQRTFNKLLHHHCSKISVLQNSAFFMVQLSHLYRTTGKVIALTRWTFVDKMMSAFSADSHNSNRIIYYFPNRFALSISKALLSRPTCLECSLLFSYSSRSK